MSSLTTFSEETSRDLLICFLWLLKNVDSSILRQFWTQITREQLQNVIQLLDLSIATFEYKGKKQMKRHQRIGAGGQTSLFQQISSCSSTKKPSINSVKNQLEKSIIGNENARTEMLNRNKQKNPLQSIHGSTFKYFQFHFQSNSHLEPTKSSNNLRWRKDQTHWKQVYTERFIRFNN